MTDWLDIYSSALRIRLYEEELRRRYDPDPATARIKCPTHFSIGQELCAAVVCHHLSPEDRVFASHRNHHWYLAKGGDMEAMTAELYGRPEGCCGGRGGSMHLADRKVHFWSGPILGDSISLAVGSALAAKMSKEKRVTVAAFGDAVLETGQFWEALNFASLHRLRLLFVCENNSYATQTYIGQRQPTHRSPWRRVRPFLKSALASDQRLQAFEKTVRHALGNLPFFLDVHTYRFLEHVGPNRDDELGYRPKEEVDVAWASDPLPRLAAALPSEGVKRAWVLATAQIAEAFPGVEALVGARA